MGRFLLPPARTTITADVESITVYSAADEDATLKLVIYENQEEDGLPGKLIFEKEVPKDRVVSIKELDRPVTAWTAIFEEGEQMESYVLRETADRPEASVAVDHRDGGFVYFKAVGDTSGKLDRLEEGEFQRRYVKESELRLEESIPREAS